MGSTRSSRARKGQAHTPLMVRLDGESKECLVRAAELRRISISDYVRQVAIGQARREVESARAQTVALTADEQLAFWNALREPVELSAAQRRLGAVMRGEA